MKILVLYFSGTGNTAYAAQYIKTHLEEEGNEITVSPVEIFDKGKIGEYDLLIFGFPVFACDAPHFIKEHLKEMPLTAKKAAALFCTKAMLSGMALKKAGKVLEEKGYTVVGYADITMPGSDGLGYMGKDSKTVRKIMSKDFSELRQADALISRVKALSEAKESSSPEVCGTRFEPGVAGALAGGLLGVIYSMVEKGMKSKLMADGKCIRCGKCEKICPAHNIHVSDEGVYFGSSCYLCMRCIHQCPKEAIQLGKGTAGKFRWKGPLGKYVPPNVNNK